MDSEIRHALESHAEWKTRISRVIQSGESDLKAEDVCRDDRCRLGHWLHGLDDAIKTNFRWRCVRQVHAEFHVEAGKALKLALSGDRKSARAAIGHTSRFGLVSARLMAELANWRSDEAARGLRRTGP